MRTLVEQGQHPEILLISCSDSRVDPALLTGALPGELFVIRNVANLVPPYLFEGKYDGTRAAIEYAIRDLKVSHVVILGHAHCGGIKALLSSGSGHKMERDFIGDWVSIALDACCARILNRITPDDESVGMHIKEIDFNELREHQHLVERAAIQSSIDNLATYPWLKARMDAGELHLHGWWFDLETGDLWVTDNDNVSFLPILD